MRQLMFNFNINVPADRQRNLLKEIEAWPDIYKAAHLKPDAKRPEVRRMCVAYLSDDADLEAVREKLLRVEEIETAVIPAARELV
jgi:hypothetical protein